MRKKKSNKIKTERPRIAKATYSKKEVKKREQ